LAKFLLFSFVVGYCLLVNGICANKTIKLVSQETRSSKVKETIESPGRKPMAPLMKKCGEREERERDTP
jgi:hypothetical protein